MQIGTHNGQWAVFAEWLGQIRPVFTGSLFACIDYREENR